MAAPPSDNAVNVTDSTAAADADAKTLAGEQLQQDAEMVQEWPALSTARQLLLVLAMTLAMMLNVRPPPLLDIFSPLMPSGPWQIMQVQAIQLALPTIGIDLGIKTTNLQWLISAYSVAFGGLLLLFGRIADIVCARSFSLSLGES
jgi:hypothetical protein